MIIIEKTVNGNYLFSLWERKNELGDGVGYMEGVCVSPFEYQSTLDRMKDNYSGLYGKQPEVKTI